MASADTDIEEETVAELVHRLGDIPLRRILMRPLPGTATEKDVLKALEAPRKRICELIDGVLVEKAMGYRESRLGIILARILDLFVTTHDLGLVTGPDGIIHLWRSRLRAPDICFISWDRLPGRRMPDKAFPKLAPDLTVEILSRSNTRKEMLKKREDYFKVGVRIAWEVDPVKRTVTVYNSPAEPMIVLTEKDTLDGGRVLPDFKLSLRKLFAELDRHG
jgi:Uma2 family endonuclease